MAQNASVIDSVETLEAHLKTMREAQAEFAKFTQEQVDKISSMPLPLPRTRPAFLSPRWPMRRPATA